jgi:uncharacterized protein YqfA (UPF0365 family)
MTGPIQIAKQLAQDKPLAPWVTVVIVVAAIIFLIVLGVIVSFFKTWIRAMVSGAPVSFGALIGMRLRKVPASLIVEALIMARKAGLDDVTLERLEVHSLAGGNVIQVVRALVAAGRANIDLTFEHAAAIDLDGRDVFAEVQQAAGAVPPPQAADSLSQ